MTQTIEVQDLSSSAELFQEALALEATFPGFGGKIPEALVSYRDKLLEYAIEYEAMELERERDAKAWREDQGRMLLDLSAATWAGS